MKILHCDFMKKKSTKSIHGTVQFDELGYAEVNDEIAASFAKINHFKLVDAKPSEAEYKAAKLGPDGKTDEQKVKESILSLKEKADASGVDFLGILDELFGSKKSLNEELLEKKVDELKKMAADLGIELEEGAKKPDIIKAIVDKKSTITQ